MLFWTKLCSLKTVLEFIVSGACTIFRYYKWFFIFIIKEVQHFIDSFREKLPHIIMSYAKFIKPFAAIFVICQQWKSFQQNSSIVAKTYIINF